MSDALPVVYLARHGETAWTISRQHTEVTDLPLTARGEVEAGQLGERLEGLSFARDEVTRDLIAWLDGVVASDAKPSSLSYYRR
jgi:broad specificity phosphatase PhoE